MSHSMPALGSNFRSRYLSALKIRPSAESKPTDAEILQTPNADVAYDNKNSLDSEEALRRPRSMSLGVASITAPINIPRSNRGRAMPVRMEEDEGSFEDTTELPFVPPHLMVERNVFSDAKRPLPRWKANV